ncbi:N-acetylmuramoyl-L-alanine amidase [Marvinbryantia formatexigens DSM 14469]|uniref:N-acetylmuramoyl-L-alanine amidase n=1 Tax=Marvinbryantia formatexigens DSM 14469 TaxID=478749 RepID=C6LG86_9FIRM|nr:N-acetylmuramoyl-L-alanine amidase [Marvinbryantia formatexigens]EET60450.1 N-acetylmuramoyl-L-alanine amidase [Marvinbryantia formatexigens DSM 14469]UWO25213.1 N-acetylmuramoyl-L-alanine amidase [Marvinbryantia formatexigens DSM 14469]SDH05825.1 Sporulation related domain-containing protein [Marvinbryantia formatexigens]
MNINKDYISDQNTYAGNNPVNIVIHNTDNFDKDADAKAHAKAQHDGNFDGMSAHIYVDDKSAYLAAPYNRGTWHVGVNYGGKLFGTVNNRNSVAIEMCVNAGYDYEKAFRNTVEITKQVMAELGIPADRVYTHYDVCAKNCPSQIRARGDWERFKNLIGGTTGTDIKDVAIGDSSVEAIARVVYGEAGVIASRNGFLGVAQCIHDMLEDGGYGKTVTEVMRKNYSAYGAKVTSDAARQAVYDVFKKGVRRFGDAVILQFRSFTNYSDGNGKIDRDKCAALLAEYQYLGSDSSSNRWGHLYFGHKTEMRPEPLNKQNRVQCGSFSKKENAEKLVTQLKAAGFAAIIKTEDDQYKVQAGAYDIPANAQKHVKRLKAAGFDAIIK